MALAEVAYTTRSLVDSAVLVQEKGREFFLLEQRGTMHTNSEKLSFTRVFPVVFANR